MPREPDPRRLLLPTIMIGIGLSGFFDGILLHQVLQWHHLLSLVPGEPYRDVATQILADGLFHVLMYVVTASGLWLLWRRRSVLADGRVGWRPIAGGGLLGFGLWNVIDVAGFHWLLGIHRIRVAVPNPMTYDLAWLGTLGIVPMMIAWRLLRYDPRTRHGAAAIFGLAFVALGSGTLAARPVPNATTMIVVFRPGSSLADALNAAGDAGTPVTWIDPKGRIMAIPVGDRDIERRLYDAGALLVTRSPALAGCGVSLETSPLI